MLDRQYVFSGGGGETVRNYWSETMDEFIRNQVILCEKFSVKVSTEIESSIKNVLIRSFNEISKKFGNDKEREADYLVLDLYRESRNRNHFGKTAIENYIGNRIRLMPLLDESIQKLKLNSNQCIDKNLLMTLIFVRYAPHLLDFKFEGGRTIDYNTIEAAKNICSQYPFINDCDYIHSSSKPKISMDDKKVISYSNDEDINRLIDMSYQSEKIKHTFLMDFDEELYNRAELRKRETDFFPLQEEIGILTVSKVLFDVNYCCLSEKYNSYYDFLNNVCSYIKLPENNLRDHEIITNYITARIDIIGDTNKDVRINVEQISDSDAKIQHTRWFVKNGDGIIVTSSKGKVKFTITANISTQLKLILRGLDVKNDKGERLEYWIDYKMLTVDGETIIDKPCPYWHDMPFVHTIESVLGRSITIEVQWEPHKPHNNYSL